MKKLALFILEETKEKKEEQKHDDRLQICTKQLYRDNGDQCFPYVLRIAEGEFC